MCNRLKLKLISFDASFINRFNRLNIYPVNYRVNKDIDKEGALTLLSKIIVNMWKYTCFAFQVIQFP